MADGGGLPGFLLRLSLLLLLLVLASLQLQAWTSSKAILSQKVFLKSARSVKHKSIVKEEASGQGIPDRVQCEVETKWDETKKVTSIHKMEKKKQHAILRAFLESIQVSMPNSTRVTIITNQRNLKGGLLQNVDWRLTTRQYDRGNLMVQRLESYIDFLEGMMKNQKEGPTMHVIFSDFDMIVVDDVACVFKDYPLFDVALTFRNNLRQPINSGIIMVRGTLESLSRTKSLLKEVVKVYCIKFRQAFGLLGDQLALADVVKATLQARTFEKGVPFESHVLATRTLFLPCAIYNWTPSEGAGQFHGMPTEVKILHFKGSRKRLMIHAWSLYKQQGVKDFLNMKCLVLKSGRSKYDY